MIIKVCEDKNEKRGRYARSLMSRGHIKKLYVDGCVAFDLDEYRVYRKGARKGRPLKRK